MIRVDQLTLLFYGDISHGQTNQQQSSHDLSGRGTMYLYLSRKNYWISLIPDVFMLMATMTYILNVPIGFGMPLDIFYVLATIISIILVAIFFSSARRKRGENIPLEEQVANWQDAV